MKGVVYKLTREDGLEYVGIAKNFRRRLYEHSISERFKEHKITDYVILFEGDYSECEEREEEFISKYDTYKNGLNKTPEGKGRSRSPKFTTRGMKFSPGSRKKMSEKAKARTPRVGWKHSADTRKRYSAIRKGKYHAELKLSRSEYFDLVEGWRKFQENLNPEELIPYCKKSIQDDYKDKGALPKRFKSPNGKDVRIDRVYIDSVKDRFPTANPVTLTNIINNRYPIYEQRYL